MLAKELYSLNTSYLKSHYSKVVSNHIPIYKVCEEICSGKYRERIARARAYKELDDDDNYKRIKGELPAVIFAGVYGLNGPRQIANLLYYNSVIVLDIDGVQRDEMLDVGDKLNRCEYVASFWRSPSNLGYKGLVPVKYEGNDYSNGFESYHDYAFTCLRRHMGKKYNIELDQSGSDIPRLCYYSYDPNLIMKTDINPFIVNIDNYITYLNKVSYGSYNNILTTRDMRNKLGSTYKRNKKSHREYIQRLIKYLSNRNMSITYTYYEWRKVALAISESFSYDIGIKYFTKLSSLDPSKYNEEESTQFLKKCYAMNNGSISFGTIRYLASMKGFRE